MLHLLLFPTPKTLYFSSSAPSKPSDLMSAYIRSLRWVLTLGRCWGKVTGTHTRSRLSSKFSLEEWTAATPGIQPTLRRLLEGVDT